MEKMGTIKMKELAGCHFLIFKHKHCRTRFIMNQSQIKSVFCDEHTHLVDTCQFHPYLWSQFSKLVPFLIFISFSVIIRNYLWFWNSSDAIHSQQSHWKNACGCRHWVMFSVHHAMRLSLAACWVWQLHNASKIEISLVVTHTQRQKKCRSKQICRFDKQEIITPWPVSMCKHKNRQKITRFR